MLKWLSVFLLIVPTNTNSYRILGIFPYSSESHFKFIYPVMKALSERGHQVDVISKFPIENPSENYTTHVIPDDFIFRNGFDLQVRFAYGCLIYWFFANNF